MYHSWVKSVLMLMTGLLSAGMVWAGSDFRLSGPYQFQNLTVFIARGDATDDDRGMLILSEALEKGYVTVYETGNVGELEIENHSPYPVYIQSGMIVKGGRQDRVLRFDLIIRPKSGRVPLPSFCVEHGRWTKRGNEEADKFSVSSNIVSHREIKVAAKAAESQQDVWSKVDAFGEKVARVAGAPAGERYSSTSLQLMQEDKKFGRQWRDYYDYLNERIRLGDNAVGLIFAVNGQLNCADLYDSPSLFRKLFPQLLEAASQEAAAEFSPKMKSEEVNSADVFRWMEEANRGEYSYRSIDGKMELRTKENSGTIMFETYMSNKAANWIHKNILAR